jgi:hypothetical protein
VAAASSLIVDVYNATTTTILGTTTIVGAASGVGSFAFTIPTADAILEFRSSLTGASATVYGARAKFS